VITKRKQWGTLFSKEDPLTSASNERHKYFVSILEEVQQILGGVMNALNIHQAQSQTRQADDTATMSVGGKSLNNIFAILDLEDPSHAHQIIPEASKKSQPLTVTSYELEEDDDDEETNFKILCFFRDFEDMQSYSTKLVRLCFWNCGSCGRGRGYKCCHGCGLVLTGSLKDGNNRSPRIFSLNFQWESTKTGESADRFFHMQHRQ
jgi:hypothetical protein